MKMLKYSYNFRMPYVGFCLLLLFAFTSNTVEAADLNNHHRSYLTPNEVLLFRESLEFIKDAQCQRDLNVTLWGLLSNAQWAISMYDASVRNAIGTGSKVYYQMGHFDQCFESSSTKPTTTTIETSSIGGWNYQEAAAIPVQYCLVDVMMTTGISSVDLDDTSKQRHEEEETLISHWGECVPASCSSSDVAIFLHHILQRNVTVNDKMCQLSPSTNGSRTISVGMFVYAAIVLFFVMLTILCTGYHIYLKQSTQSHDDLKKAMNSNDVWKTALLSFSVIENTKKLFQPCRDQNGLNPLNGVKALAMIFILFGHAAIFIYGSPSYNVDFMSENLKNPFVGFVTNSLLFVDVYLLLSGYLFFRIAFVEVERRKGRLNPLFLYLGRYIRLTPPYMVVIGFYMTWFVSIGSGPIWQQRIEPQEERCISSWWLNLLYVNNYINTEKLCMFQSWYLSADTQLFIIAPFMLLLIYKYRKLGLSVLAALIGLSSAIPFVTTYLKQVQPTFMVTSKEAEDVVLVEYYRDNYIKTHMRASAYFIGLGIGYLAHLIQCKGIKLSKTLVRTMWIAGCIMGVGSMFSLSRFYSDSYTQLESTIYAGLHKLAWNLASGWLVLAVTTGHGGWLQRMLSWRVFVPFSRLTYCAYLCNGIVELYSTASLRTVEHTGYLEMTNYMLIHTLNTFALAIVLSLIFESPLHAVVRVLMRTFGVRGATNKPQSNNSASDATPSTSEEQVA
ncbi:nose resistant to fluoxetine protein 6-like [Musca autumnalis]|uniref:nose resistant to fluoxetine protein 6-like n=1 Tax=Musca autumnalis TaxID=221902 RepID=UPI003CF18931